MMSPWGEMFVCLFVSFIRQRCVRHNSSSFCKYIRMMIYLLALTKVFLLFFDFLLFYDVFILFRLLIRPLFYHKFLNITSRKKKKEKEKEKRETSLKYIILLLKIHS